MVRNLLKWLGVLGLVTLLAGCGPTLKNLTPSEVPRNPSGIYTLSVAVRSTDGSVRRDSFDPRVTVDGFTHKMVPSEQGPYIYDYDFAMPEGRSEARYFFTLDYQTEQRGSVTSRKIASETERLRLLDRVALSLINSRGPVGSSIAVVGQGFSPRDKVVIGGREAATQFVSPNALTFTVPPLDEGQAYLVALSGPEGTRTIGEFRVDASRLRVSPSIVELAQGERSTLAFALDQPAPAGGLTVSVQTDIPRSIIMPVVVIPAGSQSVTIPIEGAQPGNGTLFIRAPGFADQRIPLRVSSRPQSGASARPTQATPPAAPTGSPNSPGLIEVGPTGGR